MLAATTVFVVWRFDWTSRLGMWQELAVLWGAAVAVWLLCWADSKWPVTVDETTPPTARQFLTYFGAMIGCIVLVANVAKLIGKLIGSDYI